MINFTKKLFFIALAFVVLSCLIVVFFSYNNVKPIPVVPKNEKIKITQPLPGAEISSPLTIKGEARGSWYFEASFPVELRDSKNNILAYAPAEALTDWMTEEFVPFSAVLTFNPNSASEGFLVFKKDNPSGEPIYDESVEIPVKFLPATEKMTVKVFFGNENKNPGAMDCSKVFSVDRIIEKTEAVGRASLEQLFLGPTDIDKKQGYYTSINSGVKINSLKIENEIAYVDLSSELEEGVGGSCRVASIASQITETLKQFSTIKNVVISVNGRTEDILQP